MVHSSRRFRSLLFLLFAVMALPLEAQFFRPFTALRVIRTEHFEIIFPPESEGTARSVASFADRVYSGVSGNLGITVRNRIPVAITPHTDLFNSLESHLPWPHIIIFDTPMSPEWTAVRDSLENLFTHELVHAVSLESRSGFFQGLHRVFGGWVVPAVLNAPLFMIEGAAVMMESLDGTGRANDPLIRQYLFQMALEDRFLTPFQASGVWDYPPLGNAPYWYGGGFSGWLREKYGMERYARLWRAMGEGSPLSLFFMRSGFYRHFEQVYQRPFAEAWHEFKQSLWLDGVARNSDGVFRGPWYNARLKIAGLGSGGGKVFVLDGLSGRVFSHDPGTGRTSPAFSADYTGYHLSPARDGGTALVSSYRFESANGFLARAVVTEYRGGGGRTGRIWEGLYYADYFRDGVIGISSDGYRNRIVFRPGDGRKKETGETLLEGNAELLYASPAALDDRRIVFIAAFRGRRELCLYDYETGEVSTIVSGIEEDGEYWRHIRGLRVSEGRVLFSYNHDGRMYKLGIADLSTGGSPGGDEGSVVFGDADFSGGVFLPASAGGQIYYRGAFALWDELMRYPGAAEMISGRQAPLRLRRWEDARLAEARPGGDFRGAGPDQVALEAAEGRAAEPPEAPSGGFSLQGETPPAVSKAYFGAKYFNPFRLWLPLPLLRPVGADGAIRRLSLDGGGILSYMSDPIEQNRIVLLAFFDARRLVGDFSLEWTNSSFGFPFTLSLSDTLDQYLGAGTARRITGAALGGILTTGLGGENLRVSLQPQIQTRFYAADPGDESHPYSWDYDDPWFFFVLGTRLSNLLKHRWETFGSGLSASLHGIYMFSSGGTLREPRVEGSLGASFEPRFFPLRLRLYGVWDRNRMNLSGTSSVIVSPSFSEMASTEYASAGEVFEWLAGGEAEAGLFSLDIQSSLSHLYFNRFSGSLAYRAALYLDGEGLVPEGDPLGGGFRLAQSLVGRLSLAVSTVAVPLMPITVTFTGLGILKISGLRDGFSMEDIGLDFLLSLAY